MVRDGGLIAKNFTRKSVLLAVDDFLLMLTILIRITTVLKLC